LLCHHLGEDLDAREYCQHALEIAREIGERESEVVALIHLAHALVGLGHLDEATAAYYQSFNIRRDFGQLHLVSEPLAGLVRVRMMQNNPIEAQSLVEQILKHLESHTTEGTEEPTRIYLTCYRVLASNHDPRAKGMLNLAHKLLQERAGRIDDEKMRHSYLENVSAHREIVREFARNY
jgi:tetratricopeptide (TPR) repeat protein